MRATPQFLNELWKRRVVQLGALYLGVAWVLLQVVLALEQTLNLPKWVPQVVLVFLAVGFPVLLILAWTREPAARTATVPADIAPAAPTAAPPAEVHEPAEEPLPHDGKVSICVLPFANMSGDAEQEYFSDGISEDIITDLSKVSALHVISRNSAFVYKGQNVDLPHVARELKVSHVLEGSVRKVGGRVRITAQLIHGANNDHVWAERYDRDLSDIFALQDEISEAIVKALRLKLLPEERKAIETRGTQNAEAYNFYLMARREFVTGVAGDARWARNITRLCQRATELDPNFASAWALMGSAQTMARNTDAAADGGWTAAQRALALDPSLAEAHAVVANVLLWEGRDDGGAAEMDMALRLDPDSYDANRTVGTARYLQRRYVEAIPYFEKSARLMESDFLTPIYLVECYEGAGDRASTQRAARTLFDRAEKALAQDRNNSWAMALGATALAVLGEGERSRDWINRALLLDPDNLLVRYCFALTRVYGLKDVEGALELMGTVLPRVPRGLLMHVKANPFLDPILDNPRFQAMIAEAEARFAKPQREV